MLALYALLMQAIPRGDDPRQVLMPVIAWWDGDTGLGWAGYSLTLEALVEVNCLIVALSLS